MLSAFLEHLWQSTLFALAACALAVLLRREAAQLRHWIWFAASVKFLGPGAALTAAGRLVGGFAPAAELALPQPLVGALEQAAQPLSLPVASLPATVASGTTVARLLIALWACGAAMLFLRWLVCWWRMQLAVRRAVPCPLDTPLDARASAAFTEPGVFGVIAPVLLLPAGMVEKLTPAELRAILAHELCHVHRRDNLTGAIHMLVEALFWFHPLVWWIGARLVEERERACDEAVVALGHAPHSYAGGILKVCRLRLTAEPSVVASAAGADLRQRIERIMQRRPVRSPGLAKKLAFLLLAAVLVSAPVAAGIASRSAQPEADAALWSGAPLRFVARSIELSADAPGDDEWLRAEGGRLSMRNTSLRTLIGFAYGVSRSQVFGGPESLDLRYDIEADAGLAPDDPRRADPAIYLPLIRELFDSHFRLELRIHQPAGPRCIGRC